MERLWDSLDPAHLSIWRRARREGLPKGRQNCNGPDAFSREPNQICPCQFCHVLSVVMKKTNKKKKWVGSEAEICCPIFPLQSKWEGRWCLIEELISLATTKAKLRFLFPLIFFWSLKGRQQLLPPGFIMSKRKLIGYWIRFSEVQLKKVNPFSFLFFFAFLWSLHTLWSKSILHLWHILWPQMWKRLYMMSRDDLSHYKCDLYDLSGAAGATPGKAYSPWSLLTSQLLSLRSGLQDQSLEECSS